MAATIVRINYDMGTWESPELPSPIEAERFAFWLLQNGVKIDNVVYPAHRIVSAELISVPEVSNIAITG
jgi:hypothetical protein